MKTLAVLLIAILSFSSAAAQDAVGFREKLVIYFDFDRHELRDEEKVKLDEFLEMFKRGQIPGDVMIQAYCDIKGTVEYNDLLARRRAFTVHEYLLNNGFVKTLVSSVNSYGERMPVNENRTEAERQLNRKVEISWPILGDKVEEGTKPVDEPKEVPQEPVKDFSKTAIDTVKTGDILRLKNINFFGGRHTFLPTAYQSLDELLEVMKSRPSLVIEIQGHICCRPGSNIDGADFDAQDNNLSRNRARAVYQFLIDNGIDAKRMSYRGFAGSQPLVHPELTEEDRTANRRVEIKIISK